VSIFLWRTMSVWFASISCWCTISLLLLIHVWKQQRRQHRRNSSLTDCSREFRPCLCS
jgi:cyanate permease